jgi:hypothetical protein
MNPSTPAVRTPQPPRWRVALELWGNLSWSALLYLFLPALAMVYAWYEIFLLYARHNSSGGAGYALFIIFLVYVLPFLGLFLISTLSFSSFLLWRRYPTYRPFPWRGQRWAFAVGDTPITSRLPLFMAVPLWWAFTWRMAVLVLLVLLAWLGLIPMGPELSYPPLPPDHVLFLLQMLTPVWHNPQAAINLCGLVLPLLIALAWVATYWLLRWPWGKTRLTVTPACG